MFRAFHFAVLFFLAANCLASEADVMTICHGYGCRYRTEFRLGNDQFLEIQSILAGSRTPEEERQRIGKAVLKFFEYASLLTPVEADRGGNYPRDPDGPGKMDCIDHSTSVSSFLGVVGSHGLLRFHRPLPKAYRSFLGVFWGHWSAQIIEVRSQTAYVVDSWPFDHGSEPLVIETRNWKLQSLPR